jgi:hypothetical protein
MIKSGSPDCSIDRTFTSIFHFPHKAKKVKQITQIYRNPIYLAKEYKQMIDNGQVKNQSSLARKLGISRVRICQILNLLKLDTLIVPELEKLGDPVKSKLITGINDKIIQLWRVGHRFGKIKFLNLPKM